MDLDGIVFIPTVHHARKIADRNNASFLVLSGSDGTVHSFQEVPTMVLSLMMRDLPIQTSAFVEQDAEDSHQDYEYKKQRVLHWSSPIRM